MSKEDEDVKSLLDFVANDEAEHLNKIANSPEFKKKLAMKIAERMRLNREVEAEVRARTPVQTLPDSELDKNK